VLVPAPRRHGVAAGRGQAGGLVERHPVRAAQQSELVALARRCGFRPDELAQIIEQVSLELP
jgi:hypothetical protein